MERITIKTKDLRPDFQVDGVSMEPHFKDIERFYRIPAALHNVDKNFGTHTYLDVVKAATPELKLLVEGDKMQLLDPKYTFIEDAVMDAAVDTIEKNLGVQAEVHNGTFQRDVVVKLKMEDDDHYLNDAFSRHWTLTRRPEGGVSLSSSIVRLSCTNGMVMPDKQFTIKSRTALPTIEATRELHATVSLLKVAEYLEALFTQDGEQVPCSFADMLDMQKCLIDLTDDPEFVEGLFPVEGVKLFYTAQGIDTTKLARKWLDKLPTGLTYYQSLQILTNGAKRMTAPTIENQVKVARFCAPKRMKNLKDTNLQWSGAPKWDTTDISHWMGDR